MRASMNRPVSEPHRCGARRDSRELESEPGHPDPLEGRVFSVSEVFDAKSVERRVSVFEVEPAAIDFD